MKWKLSHAASTICWVLRIIKTNNNTIPYLYKLFTRDYITEAYLSWCMTLSFSNHHFLMYHKRMSSHNWMARNRIRKRATTFCCFLNFIMVMKYWSINVELYSMSVAFFASFGVFPTKYWSWVRDFFLLARVKENNRGVLSKP